MTRAFLFKVVEAGILVLVAAPKLAAAPAAVDPLAEAWSQAKAMTRQAARPIRPVPGQDQDEVPVITPLPNLPDITPIPGVPDLRKSKGSRQVASMSAISKAIEKGRKYLLRQQLFDGSWGVGDRRFRDTWDNAFLRVGVTAYAVSALRAAGEADDSKSLRMGLRFVSENGLKDEKTLEREGDEFGINHDRPYGLAFGLLTTLSLKPQTSQAHAARREEVKGYLKAIEDMALSWSGISYVRGSRTQATFQLALVASSLLEARRQGYELPAGVLQDILASLEGTRADDGSYPYVPGGSSDLAEGAARTVMIETVLHRAGRSTGERLKAAVGAFLKNRADLEKELKNTEDLTHNSENHNWAKYYYFFGVYWTAQALDELDAWEAPGLAHELAVSVLKLQNDDNGSWVDSPEATGPSYGTAMGILSLDALRKAVRRFYDGGVAVQEG